MTSVTLWEVLKRCKIYAGDSKKAADAEPPELVDVLMFEHNPWKYFVAEIPKGYLVVDIDIKGLGVTGISSTTSIRTPNGVHHWYRLPLRYKCPKIIGVMCDYPLFSGKSGGNFWRNVDILVEGAYAAVPPSPGYTGSLYTEIAYAHPELMNFIYEKCYSAVTKTTGGAGVDTSTEEAV